MMHIFVVMGYSNMVTSNNGDTSFKKTSLVVNDRDFFKNLIRVISTFKCFNEEVCNIFCIRFSVILCNNTEDIINIALCTDEKSVMG